MDQSHRLAFPDDALPPEGIYKSHKEYAHHNHPPSPGASAHPAHRQLNEGDAAIISSLTTAGAAPRDIRTYLHNSSDTLATQQDIYNRIAATRRDLREGQSSIQAAEGIHSLIKSYIKTSTFDLFDSWQAMRHAVTNQLKELNHIRASQQIRTPLDISGGMFEAVQGWVSHQALRKVQEQRKLALASPQAPCKTRGGTAQPFA
ncbi:hypothetical protein HZS61_013688 [Fusarium oxysporum f. sp. conglutinans]|uniref:Uncharacterized protein n=1 Tax=Fusarium oxysporum f. sp. conglutinans TaxID=100902 RepID=A0A8H6GRF0_FUSOX|nr:hypothetical protein HZS61_013688 [Fusarium oxysporum f. sp. conglutinans]